MHTMAHDDGSDTDYDMEDVRGSTGGVRSKGLFFERAAESRS